MGGQWGKNIYLKLVYVQKVVDEMDERGQSGAVLDMQYLLWLWFFRMDFSNFCKH